MDTKAPEKKNGEAIMKKRARLLFVCIYGCLTVNCMYDDIDSIGTDDFYIYANREVPKSTKTELQEDNSIVWTEGDAISFFAGSGMNGGYKLISTHTGKTTKAIFKGSGIPDVASGPYWAVYPYDATAMCDGHSITTILLSKQIAKTGTFADSLFISVAKSESNVMTFYNVCGGIKFSVANEGIREVVLTNNDGGMLSGTLNIGFNENGIPIVNSITKGSSSIRIIAPDGGTFAVGKNYYAVIPPVTLSKGITMKFLTRDGKEAENAIRSSSTIERSIFTRILKADAGISFKNCPYLTFLSEGESTLKLSGGTGKTMEYSFDGIGWQRLYDNCAITFTKDLPLFLRGLNEKTYPANFIMEGSRVACYGNIMKLLDYSKDILKVPEQCFKDLFRKCMILTHAPELPATKLSKSCYESMFYMCKSLEEAPKLPAKTLAEQCYYFMFYFCNSLRTPPELPATTLAKWCYGDMFSSCWSLEVAPKLPATTLAERCYDNMFALCESLRTPPELPATTLAERCYEGMFSNCKSLEVAPKLPVTDLKYACYCAMFSGCKSLIDPPELPAMTLAPSCYASMFAECSDKLVPPILPATTLAEGCYAFMFRGSSITMPPELPATVLASSCYYQMFDGCRMLKTAPKLPALILAYRCYWSMFGRCTSLTSAPQLPATTLSVSCYAGMFSGCVSLISAPILPALTLEDGCYYQMFEKCENLDFVRALFTGYTSDCSGISDALNGWLSGVKDNGLFIKNKSSRFSKKQMSIPDSWAVSEQ